MPSRPVTGLQQFRLNGLMNSTNSTGPFMNPQLPTTMWNLAAQQPQNMQMQNSVSSTKAAGVYQHKYSVSNNMDLGNLRAMSFLQAQN